MDGDHRGPEARAFAPAARLRAAVLAVADSAAALTREQAALEGLRRVDLTGQQESAVAVIERNGHRLLGLVEDLMAYTQLSAGAADLTLGAVEVPTLPDTVATAVAADAAGKRHEVTVTVAPGTPSLWADLVQLDRMLLNLVASSVKFTPAGGRITLTAGPGDPGQVRFQVTDTGTGIPDHEQAGLFTRFHRSAQAMRDAVPGPGSGW